LIWMLVFTVVMALFLILQKFGIIEISKILNFYLYFYLFKW
jgi:hypothetical protein